MNKWFVLFLVGSLGFSCFVHKQVKDMSCASDAYYEGTMIRQSMAIRKLGCENLSKENDKLDCLEKLDHDFDVSLTAFEKDLRNEGCLK